MNLIDSCMNSLQVLTKEVSVGVCVCELLLPYI